MRTLTKAVHLFSAGLFAIAMSLFPAPLTAGQAPPATFDLFPEDSNMGRTDLTHDETASARPVIRKQDGRIYQTFIDKHNGRELFRVFVGTNRASWWVYGLVREADFNGDGVPDFTWHGGDDTSELNLLILSSPVGYKKVDLEATLRREWRRRFPQDPAEKAFIDDPVFSDLRLHRQGSKLQLQGAMSYSTLSSGDDVKQFRHALNVDERNFVYVK